MWVFYWVFNYLLCYWICLYVFIFFCVCVCVIAFPGCRCPPNLYMQDGGCVNASRCKCLWDGLVLLPGDRVTKDNCSTWWDLQTDGHNQEINWPSWLQLPLDPGLTWICCYCCCCLSFNTRLYLKNFGVIFWGYFCLYSHRIMKCDKKCNQCVNLGKWS